MAHNYINNTLWRLSLPVGQTIRHMASLSLVNAKTSFNKCPEVLLLNPMALRSGSSIFLKKLIIFGLRGKKAKAEGPSR